MSKALKSRSMNSSAKFEESTGLPLKKRTIKSAEEIPKWFDIKKYDGLKSLDLAGWSRQISYRSLLHWILADYLPRLEAIEGQEKKKEFEQQKEYYRNEIETFFDLPVIPMKNESGGDADCKTRTLEKDLCHSTVRPLTVEDAHYLAAESYYRNTSCESSDVSEADSDATPVGPSSEGQVKFLKTPIDLIYKQARIDGEGLAHIVVNLAATDEQILGDFRYWLASFRTTISTQAPSKQFTRDDCQDWIKSRVIPYIDLLLWSLHTNCTITQNVMGRALFPDDFDGDPTERIRRTTRQKANSLLQYSFARALEIQVNALSDPQN